MTTLQLSAESNAEHCHLQPTAWAVAKPVVEPILESDSDSTPTPNLQYTTSYFTLWVSSRCFRQSCASSMLMTIDLPNRLMLAEHKSHTLSGAASPSPSDARDWTGAPATFFPKTATQSDTKSIVLFALPRVIVVIYLCVLFAWIFLAEGGIGVEDSSLFGLHALGMSMFGIVCAVESALAFRTPWLPSEPEKRKMYHAAFHVLGLACGIGGLVAIVYYKQLAPPAADDDVYAALGSQYFPYFTLYSPHSWLGIVFLSLWVFQLLARFLPQITGTVHSFIGLSLFVLGLGVSALGFQDMQSSDLAGSVPPGLNITYEPFMGYFPESTNAQLSCAAVMLLAALGGAVFAAIVRP